MIHAGTAPIDFTTANQHASPTWRRISNGLFLKQTKWILTLSHISMGNRERTRPAIRRSPDVFLREVNASEVQKLFGRFWFGCNNVSTTSVRQSVSDYSSVQLKCTRTLVVVSRLPSVVSLCVHLRFSTTITQSFDTIRSVSLYQQAMIINAHASRMPPATTCCHLRRRLPQPNASNISTPKPNSPSTMCTPIGTLIARAREPSIAARNSGRSNES